jgi:DNA-binding IclR family transcriptional regulator
MEFLAANGWSGVTEVANEIGIHKSTAYRLLTTLRDRNLVEQDTATEKYRLGFGLVALAGSVTNDLDILRCARPVCERLSGETEETVTVAVLEGDEAVIIHQDISRLSALNADWTGAHNPLHVTASGKVFLQNMDDDRRRDILSRPLERRTENTITDPDELAEHLREIPNLGYARTFEELEVGLNGIAAPILASDGSLAGTLTVSGPAFRFPEEAMEKAAAHLLAAAADISQCLGYRAESREALASLVSGVGTKPPIANRRNNTESG